MFRTQYSKMLFSLHSKICWNFLLCILLRIFAFKRDTGETIPLKSPPLVRSFLSYSERDVSVIKIVGRSLNVLLARPVMTSLTVYLCAGCLQYVTWYRLAKIFKVLQTNEHFCSHTQTILFLFRGLLLKKLF